MNLDIFTPTADSVTISATTSSGRVALGGTQSASSYNVLCSNKATSWAYITFGDSTVTATSAGLALPPNGQAVYTKPVGATHVAGILDSGTGTLHFTPGQGA